MIIVISLFCTQPHNTNFVLGTKENYLSGKLGLVIVLLIVSTDVIITILSLASRQRRDGMLLLNNIT